MKFVLLSGGFGIDLSWITDFIIETITTWISDLVGSALDLFSIGLTSILSLDLTILEQMFTFMVDGYNVIRGFAMILMWTIAIFQLVRAMLGPMTNAEEPLKLIARTALFAFFVYTAKDVTLYAVNLAKIPYAALQSVAGGTGPISFSSTQTTLLGAVGGTIDQLFATIITVILIVIIAWNYFKLCLEAVERYALLGIMVYTSPLAFSMGPAQSTKNVFSAWIKMVGSQIVLMMSNVFFLRGFAYAYSLDIGSFNQILANLGMQQSLVGAATLWCFLLIAWLKIGQRFDSYLNSLGLSAAQTGGNMGAELLATAHMVKSAYDSAKVGINKLTNSIADRKAAGGSTNPAASYANNSGRIGTSQQGSSQNQNVSGQKQSSNHQEANSSVMGKQQGAPSGNTAAKETAQNSGIVGKNAPNSSGKANESGSVLTGGKTPSVNDAEKPVGEPPINPKSAEDVFPGLAGSENAPTLDNAISEDNSVAGGNAQDATGNITRSDDAVTGNDAAQGISDIPVADVQTPVGSDNTSTGSELPNMANDTSVETGGNMGVPVGETIPHTGTPESVQEKNGSVPVGSDNTSTSNDFLNTANNTSVETGGNMDAPVGNGTNIPSDNGMSDHSQTEDSTVPVGMTTIPGTQGQHSEEVSTSDSLPVGADAGARIAAEEVSSHTGGIIDNANSDQPSVGNDVSAVGGYGMNSSGSDIGRSGQESESTEPYSTNALVSGGIGGNNSIPVGNGSSNRMEIDGSSGNGVVSNGGEAVSRMGERITTSNDSVPVGNESASRMESVGETGKAEISNSYGHLAAAGAVAMMSHSGAGTDVGGQEHTSIGDDDVKPIGDMAVFKGASIQSTRQDGVSQMRLTNGCSSTSYSAEKYDSPHAPHTTVTDRDGNLHYITQPTANYEMFDGLTPMQNMFNSSASDAMDISRAKNPDYSNISEGKFTFHGATINGERVKLTAYDTAVYSPKGIEGQDYFLRQDQNGSTWVFSKKRLHKYPLPKKRRR